MALHGPLSSEKIYGFYVRQRESESSPEEVEGERELESSQASPACPSVKSVIKTKVYGNKRPEL